MTAPSATPCETLRDRIPRQRPCPRTGCAKVTGIVAELEYDAAPDEAGEHQDERNVERAQQHRIGEREGGHQWRRRRPARFVAVPDSASRSPWCPDRLCADGGRECRCRDQPSMTTYIIRPKAMMMAQMIGGRCPSDSVPPLPTGAGCLLAPTSGQPIPRMRGWVEEFTHPPCPSSGPCRQASACRRCRCRRPRNT
jgi:hypothetical protein